MNRFSHFHLLFSFDWSLSFEMMLEKYQMDLFLMKQNLFSHSSVVTFFCSEAQKPQKQILAHFSVIQFSITKNPVALRNMDTTM